MPWHVEESDRCPDGKPWAVIKNQDSSVVACHMTKQMAQKQMAALYANEQQEAASPMADNPKQPYGDVPYADPGYQQDKQKRYPLDTAAHVKAAWSYINMPKNASQYSSEQLASIKDKIKAAAKKFGIEISDSQNSAQPPPMRDGIRGVFPLEVRAVGDDGFSGMPTLFGHFAVFNRWTEIDSLWEGRFMESIAPGAFKKSFQEHRGRMRCLFQHGKDPQVGDKVLGPIRELREDDEGAYYEVPLYDTSYNRDLLPALSDGQYGASFRFTVMKESIDDSPERSEWNPEGIPQRVVQELRCPEFGPVTFPAYADATAGIRSLTDDFIIMQLAGDPERLQRMLEQYGLPPRAPREVAEPALARQEPRELTPVSGEPQHSSWPQITREEFLYGKTGSERSPFGR